MGAVFMGMRYLYARGICSMRYLYACGICSMRCLYARGICSMRYLYARGVTAAKILLHEHVHQHIGVGTPVHIVHIGSELSVHIIHIRVRTPVHIVHIGSGLGPHGVAGRGGGCLQQRSDLAPPVAAPHLGSRLAARSHDAPHKESEAGGPSGVGCRDSEKKMAPPIVDEFWPLTFAATAPQQRPGAKRHNDS